ncbi:sugar phosphate isomerase/epimerase family protein [Laedolimicola ammoniilytica]|uniref:Sugar phosphate isomerase/epimerase n=1 Tax=Laedolimicola ammoniilytica TaxID=2981771 RepID=A0ABT2S0J3_9FIRM|nr:sugar phosphate isomerase/epimerase family protein [Laedolimicola ammoniilytica]MCC2826705.1 sugar phosphate isomerase/epimerase [Faecalicatena orotica]MCU6698101.1 sugar phosphate isomerase/epimerase [Laedolimicola ammoniilytica]SCH88829.1 D-tagatose 3-epimerase [uncultured Clostridium sp.]SCI63617.1 D-tagatose 3-epimerase [uncultured Clostridium sp.]
MLYGIYYAYWEKEWGGDFIPYIRKVKKLGFDILEVACHNFSDTENEYLYQLKEAADAEGIILTGGYGNDSTHNISGADPMIVKAAFDKFEKTFQKMNIAGIKLLGGSLYSYWPVDYSLPLNKKEDMKRGIENVRILADMAAEYEITLGMEVLNRFEGYMLNTCEEAVDFVSKIDRPNVKVMLDTFHMNIEEDSFGDAIRMAGKYLGHLHLGEANRRPPFRGGRIPWDEIGEALHDIEYTGTVVMEPFVRMGGTVGKDIRMWHDLSDNCPDEKLDQDVAESVRFLREIWE